MNYGPPMSSDSEDEFYFGGDYDEYGHKIKATQRGANKCGSTAADRSAEHGAQLIDAIRHGTLAEFEELRLKCANPDINRPILAGQSWNALMYASHERNVELVKRLLVDLGADPNGHSNETPLILVCQGSNAYDTSAVHSAQTEQKVLEIVRHLVDHGAIINMSNGRGETAFMFAAQNGFATVVELLLNNNVSIEACDNQQQRTAIFYAVEANRLAIVRRLIDAGALINATDRFQDTPKLIAQQCGFGDIEQLFATNDDTLHVPSDYWSYSTYKDLIPTAFPEHHKQYTPEIYGILESARLLDLEYLFYESKIPLSDLLSANDGQLSGFGIEFPFQRKRILHALLRLHVRPWTQDSLCTPPKGASSPKHYFNMYANCLKHLVVLKASMAFYANNDFLDQSIMDEYRCGIQEKLHEIDGQLKEHEALMNAVDAHTTARPLLLVDQQTIVDRLYASSTIRAKMITGVLCASCIGLAWTCFKVLRST